MVGIVTLVAGSLAIGLAAGVALLAARSLVERAGTKRLAAVRGKTAPVRQ